MALQGTPGSDDTNLVQFRIERGAAAMGTDGPLGTVEQIVVDRDSGVLRALIVRSADGAAEFELPADHVQRSAGDTVYLDIGRADLARRPELATPYDPEQYVPVYQGETAPTGQASRTALDAEQPVVTDVEENAAELVAPEMTPTTASAAPPTDTAATVRGGTAATTGRAPTTNTVAPDDALSTTWVPRRGATPTEGAVPAASDTVTVSTDKGPQINQDTRDATAADEQAATDTSAPPQSVSTRPSVTGPLVGGKPSTSGMGVKSAVPRSDVPPFDSAATPPAAPVTPPAPGMMQAFSEAGSEPAFASPSDRPLETDAVEVEGVDISTNMPSPTEETMAANVTADTLDQSALNAELTGSAVTPERDATLAAQPAPVPVERQLPSAEMMSDESPSFMARMQEKLPAAATLPTLALAAAGVGVGITAIALRQRQAAGHLERQRQAAATAQDVKQSLLQATEQAKQGMKQATATTRRAARKTKRSASQVAGQATVAAAQTAEQAKRKTKGTTHDAKRGAQRAVRRARWFRRGLLVGAGLAILFAPQPGAQLRERIAGAVEQVRAKIA